MKYKYHKYKIRSQIDVIAVHSLQIRLILCIKLLVLLILVYYSLKNLITKAQALGNKDNTVIQLNTKKWRLKSYGVCPLEDALEDFLLPNPKILKPPLPVSCVLGLLPVVVVAATTTSGFDPFLAAKSWKLIGGADARRGLLE